VVLVFPELKVSVWRFVGGIYNYGIRNNQNIFRKIIINNSENKQEFSYTPKLLTSTVQSRSPERTASSSKINPNLKHPPQKNKNKKRQPFLVVFKI
jgi:hypothetical protein